MFVQQMIKEHENTSAELKDMIASNKVKGAPVADLTEDDKEQVGDLAKLDGKEFDEELVDAQVEAHENAVNLLKRYGEEGDNAELKAWASKTLHALQHH